MPRLAWIIAGVLTTVLVVGLVGFSAYQKSRDLTQATEELAAAHDKAEKDAAALDEANRKLAESQTRMAQLQQEKSAVEAAVKTHKSLEDEMRAALESKDVTISQLQGRLTVSILDRVLFDSGEAQLKPDGEAVLQKVAVILTQHPTLKVHVVGHTDNVPIRAGSKSGFASNWELSTARATAAVRFFTERAGVDPRRLGAVGYGEFRPVADNSTAEGRAKNRRIAIVILPEELGGLDAPPPPAGQTNSPPTTITPGKG